MKTFKGFNQNLSCMDFQFNIGETFTHTGNVEACASGFHACENPLDIFTYYPPANSRFCLTESSGDIETHKDDSKIASSILDIVKELSLAELCNYGAEYILNNVIDTETDTGYRSAATNTGLRSAATNTGDYSVATNTGNNSVATNTGYQSAATNTGAYSVATNTGYQSAATNTGDQSAATNTGGRSSATNTGDYSAATNTGAYSAATNTGNNSAATNTGYRSAATNTGHYSTASVEGVNSVAMATGVNSKAKASLGSAIVLCHYSKSGYLIGGVFLMVGEGGIKDNTWYAYNENGTIVEIEE